MIRPATTVITLPFGATTAPYSPASPHNGVDFAYTPDDIIYAPFSGRVSQVADNGRDGNGTYMTEPNGNFHGLLHASRYLVPNGTMVREGQPIAVMGATGFAQGVHLHWCVKQGGVFIDPLTLLKGEEVVDILTARILSASILGNNGTNGTKDALAGETDSDLQQYVGQDLHDVIWLFYDSDQGKQYREYLQHVDSPYKLYSGEQLYTKGKQ